MGILLPSAPSIRNLRGMERGTLKGMLRLIHTVYREDVENFSRISAIAVTLYQLEHLQTVDGLKEECTKELVLNVIR